MLYTRFHAIRKRWLLVSMAVIGAVLTGLVPLNEQQTQQSAGSATRDLSATSAPKQSPTSSSAPLAKNDPNTEITVQDSGNTTRNLVQVHVVVRDADATGRRPMQSRLTAKLSFDLRPGKYPVRQVIPDSEGSQMPVRNGAVDIPN
jgi:hypothetical protein